MRTLIGVSGVRHGPVRDAGADGSGEEGPPTKLTFTTKNGNVTFDHSAHVTREKGNCAACHPKLFMQDAKAPLNFKAGLHKTAETNMTSCGACHHAGGPAFETKGNCAKCHMKG